MTAASVVRRGRMAAERLMTSTAVVTRVTGSSTSASGVVTPTFVTIYTGKARRQSYQPNELTPESAGHTATIQRYATHFPIGAFVPEVGDIVTWTANPEDPALVGAKDRVAALFNKTQATTMRLYVDSGVA